MKLRWTERADAELFRLWRFVAEYDVARADRIEAEIKHRVEILARFPRLGRPTGVANVRRLSLVNIQYVVTYQLDDDEVRIIRVRHTRQDGDGT